MKKILKGILLILKRQEKLKLVKLIIADVAITLLDLAFLGLLLLIVNFYTQNTAYHNLSFLPPVLVNHNSLLLIGAFLMLFGIKNYTGFLVQSAQHHFFYDVASRLSKQNIQNYLDDDHDNFVSINSAVQIRKISQQPIEFSHYILTSFQQVISQGVVIFFTVGAIVWAHPTLFILLFILLLPPVAILAWFIRSKLKTLRSHIKMASVKTIQHLNESLSGYVESNIYGKNDFFIRRYFGYQQQLNQNIAAQQTLQSLPSRLMEFFAVLGFFILVALNRFAGNTPAISIFTIGIFMVAAYKIIPGVVKILNSTGQIKTYEFTLADLAAANQPRQSKFTNEPVENISSVKFERVDFSYTDQQVLNDLSFELLPGDMAGISGNSGRGKTTIINLLMGFLEPAAGAISINGKAAGTVLRLNYCKNISLVKQQPFFIHASILTNIVLDDDAVSEQKLTQVLEICGLNKLLAQYTGGIHQVISENGKNISGGQRQRIMLARALYHNFDLLILDEPFSEMDAESENEILLNLQQLAAQGKMIMFITHNKASLAFCNKIILPHG